MPNNTTRKTYDVIIFGASSFVGGLLVEQFLHLDLAGQGVKWAIAGRSEQKLLAVKTALSSSFKEADKLDVILADVSDEQSIKALCEQTKVVVSVVGPYALYGEVMIKTCSQLGVDYCDLTGESIWIHDMIEKYAEQAQKSGSRIVTSCGFDSIPSDLGVYFLQKHVQTQHGSPSSRIKMRVKYMRGGLSGGTVASMINLIKEAVSDSNTRRLLMDPYLLRMSDKPSVKQPVFLKMKKDKKHGFSSIPFIMAGINVAIVHRSNALLSDLYGRSFKYDEAMFMATKVKDKFQALIMSSGIKLFTVMLAIKPIRYILENYIVPKPGEGPDRAEREKGFFKLCFFAEGDTNNEIRSSVTGTGDPGYLSTSKMLAQAALCLLQDVPDVDGGIWTPASIFGDKLIARLEKDADIKFSID